MANGDPSERRILPQSSQMNSFSFAPPAYQQPPPETQQKNYVFVDEHNRHKRLKGYDGATDGQGYEDQPQPQQQQPVQMQQPQQNQQQPPSLQPQRQPQRQQILPPQQQQQQQQQQQLQQPPQLYNAPLDFRHQQLDPVGFSDDTKPPQGIYGAPTINFSTPNGSTPNLGVYGQVPYPGPTAGLQYTTGPPSLGLVDTTTYTSQQDVFPTPPLQHGSHAQSPSDSAYVTNDDQASYAGGDLADLLGNLRMNEAGSAPYLNNRLLASKLGSEETPVVGDDDDDYKSSLPPLVSGPGLKIRIPPELMPDDDTILQYFDLYFTNVHPYVPVLDKNIFYQQWRTNREAISPLLIEALLAIGGRLADDPAQGQQWLALATRHADSFMDVPRLSTLQALLVMLKAREAAPKRGYYYRSWMAIVQCVQMAKDLGLDEHYADHKAGQSCGSSPAECLMKTRIWQTIFVCEVMIGSPQGRTDLSVTEDSVDVREPPPTPGVDDTDMQVSRNFVYMTRIICNVSRMNRIYARIKRNKDWGADPEFTRMNPLLHAWPNELPPDLAITFPADGTPPWIPSSFIGNMHSYYYLSILLLHRPQLQALPPSSPDGRWKQHMMVCYSSAKLLCRLEESILQSFGLNGLQNMQRGINFTIYSVLTCILVHLVALTSPDPDFNTDAREYFTRHMRVLEKCMSSWPMADMQRQIDAMREAFSADVRKPFVLKPTFPYGSPSPSSSHPSPPQQPTGASDVTTPTAASFRPDTLRQQSVDQIIQQHQQQQQQQQQQQLASALSQGHQPTGFVGHPISPPVSVGASDMKSLGGSPLAGASLGMISAVTESQEPHGLDNSLNLASAPGWNPARIFDQWNTTFGSAEVPTLQDIQAAQAGLTMNPNTVSAAYPTAPIPAQHTFVTPAMWQESVASVYEGGLKRSWDYDS
ncbi:C6 finger domain protein [Sporothrix brasiliensis 5110]|uniref:C6 finger domain protein n=1 Tax=Sporothrix brasiliensis 5110 TaxID=1398154 RepID=A0A0C2IM64_9PEZI|nr:C6 finger domain protein [Sporothrix brasiliensis 5110]KIH88085.1 C6 finger domain protein [Sporothrix brasiliensis 5110]